MAPTGCSQPDCSRPSWGRGLCRNCYGYLYRRGLLDDHPRTKVAPDATPLQRLQHVGWMIDPDIGCWLWNGKCSSREGYPRIAFTDPETGRYRYWQVRRLAHEIWVAPLADEDYVVSKCGVPSCFAPDHLAVKDADWFLADMRAESSSARLIREDDKRRRYRLTASQIKEIDGLLRAAHLALMEGRVTKAEHEHQMLEVEQYVGRIVTGQCAPDITQAIGIEIPDDRRWEYLGHQGPERIRGTIAKRSKHGNIGDARSRLKARQKPA